jgi:hypothetical protein
MSKRLLETDDVRVFFGADLELGNGLDAPGDAPHRAGHASGQADAPQQFAAAAIGSLLAPDAGAHGDTRAGAESPLTAPP